MKGAAFTIPPTHTLLWSAKISDQSLYLNMFSGNNSTDRVWDITQVFQCKDKDLQKAKLENYHNYPENSYPLPSKWLLKYSSSYSTFLNASCPDNDFSLDVCLTDREAWSIFQLLGVCKQIIFSSVLFNLYGFANVMKPIQRKALK